MVLCTIGWAPSVLLVGYNKPGNRAGHRHAVETQTPLTGVRELDSFALQLQQHYEIADPNAIRFDAMNGKSAGYIQRGSKRDCQGGWAPLVDRSPVRVILMADYGLTNKPVRTESGKCLSVRMRIMVETKDKAAGQKYLNLLLGNSSNPFFSTHASAAAKYQVQGT